MALRGAYRSAGAFAAAAIVTLLLFKVMSDAWPARAALMSVAITVGLGFAIFAILAAAAIDAVRFRKNRPSRRRVWWQRYLIYAGLMIPFGLIQLLPNRLHWQSFSIPSSSMEPTLAVGDVILVVDGYYQAHAPQRGDLVVFNLPCNYSALEPALAAQYRKRCNTSADFIKRIVGLPGDHIQIKRGILTVNDTPAARQADGYYLFMEGVKPETWQKYRERLSPDIDYDIVIKADVESLENTDPYTVPPDRYFVLGDSRDNSADARDPFSGIGFVPAANLLARPAFVQYSTNGSAAWWQIWKWPSAIRWSRIGQILQ
ncbi:MAG TPA: signal peptidase I [Stellaceae bacterium]|jgi:signal peptidase I|nr:signal peptidase I [Stellaceae bacterium]